MAAVTITKDNFETAVLRSDKTVLLDFWAGWCGPCRMVAPVVEQIAEENEGILLGKVNVDEEMELAVRFGITSIPTLMVFKDGKITASAIGFRPKADIEKMLEL